MVIEEEILQGQYCADSPDSLRGFFSHHIREWEQGHRDGLEDVIAATPELCTPEALRIMEEAFNEVLHIMDTWWRALAKL